MPRKIFLHILLEKKISFTSHPIFPIQIIPQLAGENHLSGDQQFQYQGQILTNMEELEGATCLILFVLECGSKCEPWIIYKELKKRLFEENMNNCSKIQNPKGVRNLLVKRDHCERENHLWPQL